MSNPIGQYVNGNHITTIWDNGTRLQETICPDDTVFTFEYPESFDFKINDRCSLGCPWCHENSTPDGIVPSLTDFIETTFYKSIPPYVEMAIGGGNIFESKDLEILLDENKKRKIISNITVDQYTAVKRFTEIRKLLNHDMIHGLGISITRQTDDIHDVLSSFGNNVVLHVIAGNFDDSIVGFLSGKKVLVLGYKIFNRGQTYWNENQDSIRRNIDWLKSYLPRLKENTITLSFDCLALDQLDVRNVLDVKDEDWNILYQGDDNKTKDDEGNIICSTMYVDLPGMSVARNSTSPRIFSLDLSSSLRYEFEKTL